MKKGLLPEKNAEEHVKFLFKRQKSRIFEPLMKQKS